MFNGSQNRTRKVSSEVQPELYQDELNPDVRVSPLSLAHNIPDANKNNVKIPNNKEINQTHFKDLLDPKICPDLGLNLNLNQTELPQVDK